MDAGLRVRPAGLSDLPALTALRAAAGWGSGGLEGSFAAVAAGRQAILVAELDGRAVGTVTASFMPAGTGRTGSGHISDLVVAPRWRRRGIASELLAAAEEAVRRRGLQGVTLDVDAHNEGAMRLYLGRGYHRLGPAQFPWGPGHTLLKMLEPDGRPVPALPRGWPAWARRLRRFLVGDEWPLPR